VSQGAARRVFLDVPDLLFRSRLQAVARRAGAEITKEEGACEVAVVALEAPGAERRLSALLGRGIAVLAFGSHVEAEQLRAAREAGAEAVPNSQVASRLAFLLAAPQ